MSKRFKELFLFDIVIAILKIENYSKDFENGQSLKYDFKTWDAVIREFQIIGEATNQLIKLEFFTNEKRDVVNFRNVLVHEYFGIDEDEIWDIIQDFLIVYKNEVISEIEEIDDELKNMFILDLIKENEHIDFIVDSLRRF